MFDFTLEQYRYLLNRLVENSYSFQTFSGYINQKDSHVVILRHDVDDRPEHSLQFARIQHEMGIVGTYYFRMVPQSFDEDVIRKIASLGHEIGYHYEDMDFANGDVDKAYLLAKKHLEKLREIADVKTICMHGSPRSPFDNKAVWEKYDYRDLGIIAEPYFDLDFSKVLYLTDTGRRWDGDSVSVRDKAPVSGDEREIVSPSREGSEGSEKSIIPLSEKYSFRSTHDIIEACDAGQLPNQMMFNFHPQRWTDHPIKWTHELVWQNMKNVVKWGIVKSKQ